MQLKLYYLLAVILIYTSLSYATTFYVDNSCANNGNGTAATCATSGGAAGAWNSIKNALQVSDCAGMTSGDILEIKGHTSQDRTCQATNSCYHEDNVNLEGACHDIIIQNTANTHVVVDGTQNIAGSTWTSIGSGVYRCNTTGCSGDVGDAFAFRGWYKRGANPEEELDLIQTNTTCDTTLPAGKMKIDTSNQSICVHLSDGSSPASASYFRIPWYDPFLQAGADGMDNVTIRKNPDGGSFRIQRYRKRFFEGDALANSGWKFQGLEWSYAMDRCLAFADDTGSGGIEITNNTISFCGQEGIRISGANGTFLVEGNTITDIQTEPVFQRCSGIGSGCLPEFTDNGTGIRLINHQGAGGTVRNNVLLRLGGGMNNRARGINFEHDNNNIIVERNYIAHMSDLANTGAAIMWSGSFDSDSNDEIIVRNNLIYDVDRCFWIQYGTDYDSQAGTINYILNNTCAEFRKEGLVAEWSGSATLDGPFHVKNNVFIAQGSAPTGLILSVPSSGSTGWTTLQNNIFECDGCTTNQDIISWRGVVYERDADCTAGVDCVDNFPTLSGASYTGNKYGDINVNISGGTEPDLTIALPSEAADAGQALTTLVPDDYTGASRPATYDAGAYNIEGEPPAPTGSPLDVATARFALNTVTGLQSFTFPDFSIDCTADPCAAIFTLTKATSDNSSAANAMISVGFASSAIDQHAVGVHDATAKTSATVSRRDHRTDRVVITNGEAGIDGSAQFFDWQTNGLRLDITDAPPAAYLLTIVIMGGPDFQADVGSFTSNASVDGTTDVTSVGFLADAVLLTSARLAGTGATSWLFTLGAAVNDGSSTQGSIGCYSNNGVATSDPHALTSSLYAASLTDGGGQDLSIQVGSWDSSGFTATTKVVGVAASVSYLALKFGGAASSVVDIDTRTTLGSTNISPGYNPLFFMTLGTLARAYDVDEGDGDAGECMVSFSTPNTQFANTTTIRDGVTTTLTTSLSNDQGFVMYEHDATCDSGTCFRGHITLTSGNVEMSYLEVFSDAVRKWIGFAIEDPSAPGGGGGSGSARRGAGLLQ